MNPTYCDNGHLLIAPKTRTICPTCTEKENPEETADRAIELLFDALALMGEIEERESLSLRTQDRITMFTRNARIFLQKKGKL